MSGKAKCIKCENCGMVFLNVDEVQTHADQTGHSSFQESEEAPTVWQCVTCTKPCRSIVEKEVHQKRTGHSEFEVTTLNKTVDAEKQMKEVRQMRQAEALAEIKELTGKEVKPLKVEKAHPVEDLDESEDVPVAVDDEELVPVTVDESSLTMLMEMGFSESRAKRALHFSSGTVDGAVDWLNQHADDMDIDEPLLVPKSSVKPAGVPLTEEQKKEKIEQLRKTHKERREVLEREQAKAAELERIKAGKKMLETMREAQDQQRQRDIEDRKREKMQDRAAKEAMKAQLRRDREERLRALGKWDEEKEAQLERERLQNEAQGNKPKPTTDRTPAAVPVSMERRLESELREAFLKIRQNCPDEAKRNTALSTIGTYIQNVINDPKEQKFRKVKFNKAFESRVRCVDGSVEAMVRLGFVQGMDPETNQGYLVLPDENLNLELLKRGSAFALDAAINPFFGAF